MLVQKFSNKIHLLEILMPKEFLCLDKFIIIYIILGLDELRAMIKVNHMTTIEQ